MENKRVQKRRVLLIGIFSPLFYYGASIVGGLYNSGYNHVVDSVSDLLIIGMKGRKVVEVMMLFSNLVMVVGCLALLFYFRKRVPKSINIGFMLLGATGITNIFSTYVFRLEEASEGMAFSTLMHIVFVAGSALFVIIGSLIIGFNYEKKFEWQYVKVYTVLSIMILVIGGAISPIIIANDIPIVGLVERVSIIAYNQWFIVMTIKFYHESFEGVTI